MHHMANVTVHSILSKDVCTCSYQDMNNCHHRMSPPTLASSRNRLVVQVSMLGKLKRKVLLIVAKFAWIRHSYKSRTW